MRTPPFSPSRIGATVTTGIDRMVRRYVGFGVAVLERTPLRLERRRPGFIPLPTRKRLLRQIAYEHGDTPFIWVVHGHMRTNKQRKPAGLEDWRATLGMPMWLAPAQCVASLVLAAGAPGDPIHCLFVERSVLYFHFHGSEGLLALTDWLETVQSDEDARRELQLAGLESLRLRALARIDLIQDPFVETWLHVYPRG